jgi:hypothetical protein
VDVPRSHPSLLVDEELARVIRNESAAAVSHWWRVSGGVVCRWRKALGVDKIINRGGQLLVRAAAEKGAAVQRRGELAWRWLDHERRAEEVQDWWQGGWYTHRLSPVVVERTWRVNRLDAHGG